VAITVEGANILTRSLIIFGQGAIRCHPFVLKEMAAAQNPDRAAGLVAFDKAIAGHIGFAVSNGIRSFIMGLTGSHLVSVPNVAPETKRYYQQLTRFSSAFAFLADLSMLTMGGDLKRKEKLSARLGDILSLMYLASATLKRYEVDGRQAEDAPLMHWAIWDAMFKAQNAFEGVIANYPSGLLAWVLGRVIFPFGRPYVVPSDQLGHEVAKRTITPGATRDRLSNGMYLPDDENDAIGVIELALKAQIAAEPVEAKLRAAQKASKVGAGGTALKHALEAGVITADEFAIVQRRDELRGKVVRVDDFPQDFGLEDEQANAKDTAPLPLRLAA
jgi:acyl-CoA dehydrogenase